MYKRLRSLFTVKGYGLFAFCIFLIGIALSLTVPYLSLFCTEVYGMSTAAFGVLMAASSLSGVVINSLIAKHSDNGLDRKSIILFSAISSALGYASYLVFDHYFFLLIVVSIFIGLGAPAMPQIYAYAQESVASSKVKDKIFAMSALRSLFSLGFLIGPLCGTLILSMMGYKGVFLGTSAIFLGIASFVALFLQKRTFIQSKNQKKTNADFSLNSKQIRLPLVAFTFLFMVNSINFINTPLFIVNDLHGSYTNVGLVVSICAGLEIPIMLVLGAVGGRLSNQLLMIYGCFVAVAYYIILGLSSEIWLLIAAQLLQATFVAIVMGNGLSYFHDLLPNSPGMAATIYTNASIMGNLLGSLSGGFIAQVAGFRNVYWFCLVLVVVSFLVLRKTRQQEAEIAVGKSQSV